MPTGVYPRRRRPPQERFWEKVDKSGSCWLWTAGKAYGYGSFRVDGRSRGAHVLAYEWLVGPVPVGLQIDHLCRNRACVNPEHMEAVPQSVNILRGESPPALNAEKTHCVHGHLLAGSNLYVHPRTGYRSCVLCREAADLRYFEQRRQKRAAKRKVVA